MKVWGMTQRQVLDLLMEDGEKYRRMNGGWYQEVGCGNWVMCSNKTVEIETAYYEFRKLPVDGPKNQAMKFRDYDVSKVLVVFNTDVIQFEKALEKVISESKVIDLQFSTQRLNSDTVYYALVLVE